MRPNFKWFCLKSDFALCGVNCKLYVIHLKWLLRFHEYGFKLLSITKKKHKNLSVQELRITFRWQQSISNWVWNLIRTLNISQYKNNTKSNKRNLHLNWPTISTFTKRNPSFPSSNALLRVVFLMRALFCQFGDFMPFRFFALCATKTT